MAGFDVEAHVGRIRGDGYTVIQDLLDADQIATVRAGPRSRCTMTTASIPFRDPGRRSA